MKKAGSDPALLSSKKRLLLFHRRLLVHRGLAVRGLLVRRLLGRRFFLGRLGRSGLLLGRLGRSGLLLHRLLGLLVLRDRRDAHRGKRCCEQYGNELLHSQIPFSPESVVVGQDGLIALSIPVNACATRLVDSWAIVCLGVSPGAHSRQNDPVPKESTVTCCFLTTPGAATGFANVPPAPASL